MKIFITGATGFIGSKIANILTCQGHELVCLIRKEECPCYSNKDNIGEKYLIGKEILSFAELNKMISEVSGVPVPKVSLPDFMVSFSAFLLTGLSRITGIEPMLGMSADQIRTMKNGLVDQGTKAEKELGLVYTLVRKAIEEEVSITRGDYMKNIKEQMHESSGKAL